MTFQLGAAYSIRNCLSSELQIGIYMNSIGAECAKLFKNENWSAGTCCIRGKNSEWCRISQSRSNQARLVSKNSPICYLSISLYPSSIALFRKKLKIFKVLIEIWINLNSRPSTEHGQLIFWHCDILTRAYQSHIVWFKSLCNTSCRSLVNILFRKSHAICKSKVLSPDFSSI